MLTAASARPQVAVSGSPGPPQLSAGSERGFSHKSKRRRLAAAMAEQSVGFVPASSLRSFPLGSWLEAPLSTASCSSSSSSSSSSSYLTPVSEEEVEEVASSVAGTTADPSPAFYSGRRKKSPTATVSASPSPPSAPPTSDSLSFLTAEERRWLNGEQGNTSTGEDKVHKLSKIYHESTRCIYLKIQRDFLRQYL